MQMLTFAHMNFDLILRNWPLIIFVIFCIVSFFQIFYYLFFFSRFAFYKTKPRLTSQTHPISVIICARDEAANLARNLPGSLVQEYKTTHEVIVVNDNSFDDSKYLLEELRKEFRQLNVVELTQEAKMIPGKKFPLSIGIKSAKNEIVLLTDADCVPASENWIELMQSAYNENTEIVLGYGAYNKLPGILNKLVRWETFHTALQYMSFSLAGFPYMGVGRNLSYKKSIFFRHKGFSSLNNLPGGDDDLFINKAATKNNTAIQIHPESFTLSKPVTSWNQWIKQKQRHYTTAKYYKPVHKLLLGTYSFTHFLYLPALIASAIFFNWKYSLAIFGLRLIIQSVILFKSLKKLGEKDLYPWFILTDVWMFFYYLIFAASIYKKPRQTWK